MNSLSQFMRAIVYSKTLLERERHKEREVGREGVREGERGKEVDRQRERKTEIHVEGRRMGGRGRLRIVANESSKMYMYKQAIKLLSISLSPLVVSIVQYNLHMMPLYIQTLPMLVVQWTLQYYHHPIKHNIYNI